jgi:murein DD-endopeptidase MepM/ murein hydrolase activator NlpD
MVLAGVVASPSVAARGLRITGVSAKVGHGTGAFVDVAVRRRMRCRLEATQNGERRRTRRVRATTRRLRFAWTVPADAAAGDVAVVVRCRRRTVKVTITVVADTPGTGPLFKPSAVRIGPPAGHRRGERIGSGVPDGLGNPDDFEADVPPASGGGAFGTYWPLNTGTRVEITQGPNGGYSHSARNTRHAIDLDVPTGTQVRAGFTGVVARIKNDCEPGDSGCAKGFGNYVLLKAADRTCALHAHLSRVYVWPGMQPARYDLLGLSGYTGRVFPPNDSGAHLHYDRVQCGTFESLEWTPTEGGPLRERTFITSQNEPVPTPQPPPPPPTKDALKVHNKVTNGPTEMREDSPAYLSTVPRTFCKRDGCAIDGTDRSTGGTYHPVVCQTTGDRTTNGEDQNTRDDQNPGLHSSRMWYGIDLGAGRRGFISEVWVEPSQRGGLGLPQC